MAAPARALRPRAETRVGDLGRVPPAPGSCPRPISSWSSDLLGCRAGISSQAPDKISKCFVLSVKKTLFLGCAHTLDLADAECGRQFVDTHDRKVAPALLQVADVFLAETGALCQLLSRQTSVVPDSLDVSPDQLALIHAPSSSISIGCRDA